MKAKKRKKLLYGLDGKGVPLSYIRKVYEGNYQPPITPEYVERLIKAVREEKLRAGTLFAYTRPDLDRLNAYKFDLGGKNEG